MGPNQTTGHRPRPLDADTAALRRAERLSRFATEAAETESTPVATETPADEPVNWSRAGRVLWMLVKLAAWVKLGGLGSAGLRALPWTRLASTGAPMLETAIRERPVTRAFRVIRRHPKFATASAAAAVIAGLMFAGPGFEEVPPLSDEPITDVKEYPVDEFADAEPRDPGDIGPPVRTAAAFIDSGFVASRPEDAGTVRTVPFETYDTQPQRVEHVEFESARVRANRGVWLTGTIEEATDTPRARFTE